MFVKTLFYTNLLNLTILKQFFQNFVSGFLFCSQNIVPRNPIITIFREKCKKRKKLKKILKKY